MIWETDKFAQLDIMLSVGTGYSPQESQSQETTNPLKVKRGLFRNARLLFQIAQDHFKDALDCEKAFADHVTPFHTALQEKFSRYNLEVDDLPSLDDVQALERLQLRTKEHLDRDSNRIRKLALKLVATSFYFETERVQLFSATSATATGEYIYINVVTVKVVHELWVICDTSPF